jgi:DMSO reductase anchor subunit
MDAFNMDPTNNDLFLSAFASLGLAAIALGAAPLHLGRPAFAWRAIKGIRRSWLSREVAALSVFAGIAGGFAGMLFLDMPGRPMAGFLTVVSGIVGALCSAKLYMVPARPAWNSSYTISEFFSTALLLGSLFVRVMSPDQTWIGYATVAGCAAQLMTQTLKFLWMSQSDTFELRASSLLLSGPVRRLFLARLAVLVTVMALALIPASSAVAGVALTLGLVGEVLGRWLFFVSVVPKNIAAAFTTGGRAA